MTRLKRNIEAIQAHIPRKSKIMAVVKANAYGHGSVEVARQALESGATELAVASLEEGIVLRRAKKLKHRFWSLDLPRSTV
ncbi:hypothetical protein BsIDN1_22400 [Bacillus safensis]|uniref:Alanine racemase N-terminal domain-containing protein n=1 Tax=Bacillus safensis TaxID=561879 RepID=A0A5S9M7P2_BACIA|nr:hypothetical protein BsIDN1_22400 [Bacillus safensis]